MKTATWCEYAPLGGGHVLRAEARQPHRLRIVTGRRAGSYMSYDDGEGVDVMFHVHAVVLHEFHRVVAMHNGVGSPQTIADAEVYTNTAVHRPARTSRVDPRDRSSWALLSVELHMPQTSPKDKTA